MSSIEQKMMMNKSKDAIYLDDQQLELVSGQRGKKLLLLNGYTFSTNLTVDKGQTTYWCCRHRTSDKTPCRARARTQQKENGLFTVIISQPNHNHPPTLRALHKTVDHVLASYD